MEMTREYFLENICFPEEGRRIISETEIPEEEYRRWKRLFYQEEDRFEEELARKTEKEKFLLCLYTRMAVEVYNDFRKDGIADQVYFDTFYDFTIWYRRCVKTKGIGGLIQAKWLGLPLRRKIYRLGRLQFEPGVLPSAYGGEPALHVHIPEGEKLDPERCIDALERADIFFDHIYKYYDCLSWLLSPNLKKILGEESNIIRFQNLFRICDTVYQDRQAEERVYEFLAEDYNDYPEHTGLQKSLKKYLMKNGDPGIGYGIRERSPLAAVNKYGK